jgi:(S)-mandelate dehydrogenase
MVKPRNVEDYRRLAAKRLPRMVFDYLDGGAESERGLRRNLAAFETICFEPRRLQDVSQRDLSIEPFGVKHQMPLVIAPTGLNGALWPDGDVLLARAAASAGIPFALSTASNATIEDVANRAGGDLWFQLYVVQRALAKALTKRALTAGYKTLVLTVDVAVNGKRERDMRNGFAIPFRYSPRTVLDGALHPDWLLRQLRHGLPELANFAGTGSTDVNAQAALMNRQMDASFAWDDLKALRDSWPHRLLVKGLLHAQDAERCVQLGVDGVVISNHGARQLEDVAAPIDKLPEFAARIDRPVLIDSGIRRGADVVKALALGAHAVLLGRATLYGLAARGGVGVTDVLRILRQEIDTTLALIGCARAADLSPAFIQDGKTVTARSAEEAAYGGSQMAVHQA